MNSHNHLGKGVNILFGKMTIAFNTIKFDKPMVKTTKKILITNSLEYPVSAGK
jgi:hypothetical protein